MAEKETSFSLELALTAALIHKDGTKEYVDDTASILKVLKDVSLVQKHLKEETYFRLQKVSCSADEVLLRCFVFSLHELDSLKASADNGSLAKKLTEYASECGLEIELGLSPDASNTQLKFEIELNGRLYRNGLKYFKSLGEQSSFTFQECSKSETGTKPVKVETGRGNNNGNTAKRSIECGDTVVHEDVGGCVASDPASTGLQMSQSSSADFIGDQQGAVKKQKFDAASNVQDNFQAVTDSTTKNHGELENETAQKDITQKERKLTDTNRDEAVMHPMNLQKQVIIHIPASEVKRKFIDHVVVEIKDNQKMIDSFKVIQNEGNIWLSGIMEFAPDIEDLSCRIVINYWKSNLAWYANKISEKSSSWKKMGSSSTLRLMMGVLGNEEGYFHHLVHILQNVRSYGLKDAIMQVDELTLLFLLQARDIQSVFHQIFAFMRKEGFYANPDTLCVLGYVYGKLVVTGESLKQSKHVTADICKAILTSLMSLSQNDIPNNTLPVFEKIALSLCQIAFPERKCNFFTFLEHCFPLFSVNYLSKTLNRYILQVGFATLASPDFEYIHSVIAKTFIGSKEPALDELMVKLLRHMPLNFLIYEVKYLTKFTDNDKVSEIIHEKVNQECRSIEKTKDFKKVFELLDMISPLNEFALEFSYCIEQSLIVLLEITTNYHHIDQNVVKRILTSRFVFVNQSSCETVLKILAESRNRELHSLYVTMLSCDFVTECTTDFLLQSTIKWFDTGIRLHCGDVKYIREIDDLPFVYHHLNRALAAECVSRNDELVKNLKERAFHFLKTINVKTLMDRVFEGDYLEESGSQDIFLEHLQQHLFQGAMTDRIFTVLATVGSSSWTMPWSPNARSKE